MDLNILVRGQSNAVLYTSFGGAAAMQKEVEKALGFDGVTNKVHLIADYNNPTNNTEVGGTAFMKDWMTRNADGTYSAGEHENNLLADLRSQSATVRAAPTATIWIHNEYDSQQGGFSTSDWMNAVKTDAALVRGTLGQTAATTPYLFTDVPYNYGSAANFQTIKVGMEKLAADPSFHGAIGAQFDDADMNGYDNYGGSHMGTADATMLAHRLAMSVASSFAAYALPGSPVALAGGHLDNLGPQVVQAQSVSGHPEQVLLTVSYDEASSLKPLDATAASGRGWYDQTATGGQAATAAAIVDDHHVRLTFANPVGSSDSIFYAYGAGRLSAPDGSGEGHAIYDNNGMPIWASQLGIHMNAAALATAGGGTVTPTPTTPVTTPTPASATDTIVIKLSEDAFQGNAQYAVYLDGKYQTYGTVSALHSAGQTQDVTLTGSFGTGQHTVGVQFTNDASGSGGDRNLYVNDIIVRGVDNHVSASLFYNQNHDFTVSGTAPHAPVSHTIGSGLDSIVLKISETAYQGDAQYTVAVDGKQVGGTQTASALHGAGDDSLTVLGDFGSGQHKLTVSFLNDLYGGSAATDRNLYVDGVTYKGADAHLSAALLSNGSHDFTLGTAVAAPTATPVVASVASPAPASSDPYAAFTHDGVVDWTAAAAAVTAHYNATGYWGL